MNKMLLSVGAVSFLWAAGPSTASWVDFIDPHRQSDLDVGGFNYQIETSGEIKVVVLDSLSLFVMEKSG